MAQEFTGKRVLVTGGAKGIGRGIVQELSNRGATVLVADVNLPDLQKLKSQIPTVEIAQVNLCDWKATSTALKKLSPIDCLVNNAGVSILEPLTSTTEEHYEKVFSVNVKAMINVTRLVILDLLSRKSPGSIVNISSQASKAALLDHSLYCASKGAVDAFTRAVAQEYGNQQIRINTVNPTVVMTDLGRQIWADPGARAGMLAKIPLGRFAEIKNVVDAVVFLLSNNADMISGVNLPVDGGFLAC